MKVKFLSALLLTAGLTFLSCDDNTGTLGMGMLPGSDSISVHTKSFPVITSSVLADSVYAKTSTGYVGRFTDPIFGYYEAGFLTELNCIENFKFPEVYDKEKKTGILTGDSVSGVRLVVFYSTWFGDSLNACRMSAYELQEKLNFNRYTNIKPEDYYKPNGQQPILLNRRAYTAYDTSVTDEERNETDANGNKTYYPNVAFTLDKEKYGNRWMQLAKTNPEYFKNADGFRNLFPGIYIKSDYGDGTILYVDQVALQMRYNFYVLNDTTNVPYKRKQEGFVGEDSTAYTWRTEFASTKEVIQANQFFNSQKLKDIVNNEKSHTYIKSPAGIFTEAILPYDEIYRELSGDTLNAVKLTFTNYDQSDSPYEFSMSAPSSVLLLRKQDFKSFFEENQLPDNITSYTVQHNNVATNQYTFNNIARLVTTCIQSKDAAKEKAKEEAGDKWNEAEWERDWSTVYLIPVKVTYDTSSQTPTITSVQNDLQPGYARLKGGPEGEALSLEVTYTTFNK